jgi:hypothetical protein
LDRDRGTCAYDGFNGDKNTIDEIKSHCLKTNDLHDQDLLCNFRLTSACNSRLPGPLYCFPRIVGFGFEGKQRMRAVFGHIWVLVVATAGLGGSLAWGADVNHGAELAKRWCATCHVVAGDQKQASADVPPFAAIARRSDFTPEKVAFFLLDPHPKMPNFSLSRNEAGDLAAYIGSLRK